MIEKQSGVGTLHIQIEIIWSNVLTRWSGGWPDGWFLTISVGQAILIWSQLEPDLWSQGRLAQFYEFSRLELRL